MQQRHRGRGDGAVPSSSSELLVLPQLSLLPPPLLPPPQTLLPLSEWLTIPFSYRQNISRSHTLLLIILSRSLISSLLPPALTVKAALKAGISKCLSKFLVVPFLTLHSPLSGDTELILRLNGDFWFLGWAVEINVAGRRELGLLQRRREKSI